MPVQGEKYINLFNPDNIKDGIRFKVDTVDKALIAIKEMFEKKPNIIYGLENYTITKHEEIVAAYRNWLINNTLNVPIDKKKIIKQIFEFHFKTVQDHIVAFQSHNLDNALLMCKVNKKFINIEIPKLTGLPTATSIIATYC